MQYGSVCNDKIYQANRGLWVARPFRYYLIFAIAFLAINIILTFTDQFGLLDFITLVIDIALAGFLLAFRKGFSQPSKN
jgi:UPF0716 family protein affecting phage T7 exclusion